MKKSSWVREVLLAAALVVPAAANINSGGQLGVVRTMSAKTMGRSKLNFGGGLNYAQPSDFVQQLNSTNLVEARLFSSNLFLGLGLASFWDLTVATPLYWDNANDPIGISEFGIGDLEVSTKILYPKPDQTRLFYQSYYLGIAAGLSGMSKNGIYPRHAYYYTSLDPAQASGDIFTADGFVAKGGLIWTLDFGHLAEQFPFQMHLNGIACIPNEQKEITAQINFAMEYSPAPVLTLFVDLASEIRAARIINEPDKLRSEMYWVTPGVKINTPAGVYLMLGADAGVVSDKEIRTSWTKGDTPYATSPVPPWGLQFAFGWNGFLTAQDQDNDGIKDDRDRCPKDPEDIDNFEDGDGCPDEDNDKDGILDADDKCPTEAEDRDGFEDDDGCPDVDNDGDGIDDLKDQCPKIAEDFDGFEDKDGCPDYDNDKDGVPDSLDKCPNDVEDFDKFKDDDGCPDVDNDKDGIPDLKDKCPNEPETFNNVDDKDGCPDEKKEESTMPKHQIMHGVNFRSGQSEMTFDSYVHLDPIIEEMKKHPSIQIEIRGHTDSVGNSQTNMRLSKMRAESVRQFLISKGIDPSRIRAVGFGSSAPIADNRTAAGRAKNRRIEIVRIK